MGLLGCGRLRSNDSSRDWSLGGPVRTPRNGSTATGSSGLMTAGNRDAPLVSRTGAQQTDCAHGVSTLNRSALSVPGLRPTETELGQGRREYRTVIHITWKWYLRRVRRRVIKN